MRSCWARRSGGVNSPRLARLCKPGTVLAPGTRLATYEVRERLAVGGMGEVYLCRHRLLDRIDAVKVLRPHLVADDAFRRRFLREALAAARLRHPHIVTVYTADEVDGQLFLAMEYVAGADLAALIERDGALQPQRAVGLLAQVADALDAAHRVQMTHRDVKPSNVLVERPDAPDEHAYLVDFGLSKSQQAVDQTITQAGEVLGSVAYIAPEQLEGKDTDGRCDQYSLACMAFECLTGRLPFPRDSQLAVLTAHLTAPPPAVTSVRPELPTALDPVIARGMGKAPDDRYPTCSAFVDALRAALAPAPAPAGTARVVPPSSATRAFPGHTEVSGRAAVPPATPIPPAPGPQYTSPPATGRWVPEPAPARPAPAAPAPPTPTPTRTTGTTRLYLAVVGGPESGRMTALPDGEYRLGPAGTALDDAATAAPPAVHYSLGVSGWTVRLYDPVGVLVNGEPVHGSRALAPGDVIEAGASLLEVRAAHQLARLPPGAVLHDAVTLHRIAHDRLHVARRGPQHPQAMVVRLGWRPGRPPGPLSIPLGARTAVALRGAAEPVSALLRWLLAQAMVLHDARDLCLAVAAAPVGADRWTWLASAPHGRPGCPPISGPHWANNAEGSADLVARLRHVIEVRRVAAGGGPAHHASAVLPRVLAVIDDQLGAPDTDFVCGVGPQLGVHVVRLLGPTVDRPPPANCAICVDVTEDSRELVVRAAGQPAASIGVPDGVPVDYVRNLADTLADT